MHYVIVMVSSRSGQGVTAILKRRPADMAFMKVMQHEVISQQVLDLGESATVVTRSRIHGMYKDQNVDLKSTETLVSVLTCRTT